jgi:hypothetical protein
MAYLYRHWEVNGEQIHKIESDPDTAKSPAEMAILSYLTLPEERRSYGLGRFTIGRFEMREEGNTDCLHTGSVTGDDFVEVARGVVIDDLVDPDGLYEIYVPV